MSIVLAARHNFLEADHIIQPLGVAAGARFRIAPESVLLIFARHQYTIRAGSNREFSRSGIEGHPLTSPLWTQNLFLRSKGGLRPAFCFAARTYLPRRLFSLQAGEFSERVAARREDYWDADADADLDSEKHYLAAPDHDFIAGCAIFVAQVLF